MSELFYCGDCVTGLPEPSATLEDIQRQHGGACIRVMPSPLDGSTITMTVPIELKSAEPQPRDY